VLYGVIQTVRKEASTLHSIDIPLGYSNIK